MIGLTPRIARDLGTARRLLGVLRAHLEVAQTDRPQPYRGKLTFFAATEQPPEIANDPAHGWGELFEIHRAGTCLMRAR